MNADDKQSKKAADRDLERAVIDSFPASDPISESATQGPRAVPITDPPATPMPDAARLSRRFPDAEAAKLALENLVRAVPLDRAATTMEGSTLHLRVPRDDAARVETLLNEA